MGLKLKFLIVAVFQFLALSSVSYFDHLPLPFFASLFLLSLIVPLAFCCTISASVKRQIIAVSLAAFASVAIGIYQSIVLIFNLKTRCGLEESSRKTVQILIAIAPIVAV
ncbi:hypothetical protein AGMMS50229_01690 [Campylobacterota bacterium]|nr:hypothetical protein AGMMS50229_01690 [Campylobacterota bacterium]